MLMQWLLFVQFGLVGWLVGWLVQVHEGAVTFSIDCNPWAVLGH